VVIKECLIAGEPFCKGDCVLWHSDLHSRSSGSEKGNMQAQMHRLQTKGSNFCK